MPRCPRRPAVDAAGKVIGTVAARDVLDAIEQARMSEAASDAANPDPLRTADPAMTEATR